MAKGMCGGCGKLAELSLVHVRCLTTIEGASKNGTTYKILFDAHTVREPSRTIEFDDALFDALRKGGAAVRHASAKVGTKVPKIQYKPNSCPNALPHVPFKIVSSPQG